MKPLAYLIVAAIGAVAGVLLGYFVRGASGLSLYWWLHHYPTNWIPWAIAGSAIALAAAWARKNL